MDAVEVIKRLLGDIGLFSRAVLRRPLRGYQLAPARAIVESVRAKRGDTFAVVMSRQAGKNELSAQLEAYLMNVFQRVQGASLVKAAPTYKPQTVNSRIRLRECLDNPWNAGLVHSDEGYMVRLGRCRALFFSAQPSANVVGATATVLLECDEAQDVDGDKWSKDFAPMAASTNATTVFYGTMWTSRTLLAQVMRQLRDKERADGRQRVFLVPWEVVAAEVPAYGEYVRKEMARLGPDHPIIKTQYKLEEIDEAGRLFTAERIARMKGEHSRQQLPSPPTSPRAETGAGGEVPPSPRASPRAGRGAGGEAPPSPRASPRAGRGAGGEVPPSPRASPRAGRGAGGEVPPSPPTSPRAGRGAGGEVPPSPPTSPRAETAAGGQVPPSPRASPRAGRGAGGEVHVITVDVAGEEEEAEGEELRLCNPRKDSTVATIFQVDLSTVADPLIGFPSYYVVDRQRWTGVKHSTLYAALLDLVQQWRAAYLVVDATGIGAGLASFLVRKLGHARDPKRPGAVLPFEFSAQTKSDLGWSFLGLVDTGRYKEYADDGQPDTAQFWREVRECEFEVLPGPGHLLRWGVADPAVHDDMLVSAALVSVLDDMPWAVEVEGEVIGPGEEESGVKHET